MQLKCALALCAMLAATDVAACNLSTGTTAFAAGGASSALVEDGTLKPPFNDAARRKAGFTETELRWLQQV